MSISFAGADPGFLDRSVQNVQILFKSISHSTHSSSSTPKTLPDYRPIVEQRLPDC